MTTFRLYLVFDASVKSPIGVEYGVEYQFGNFDQCMEITTDLETEGVDIQSKYCLVDVALEGFTVQKSASRNHRVRFSLKYLIDRENKYLLAD